MTGRADLGRIRQILTGASMILPWRLRRPLLEAVAGYNLDRGSYIGLSWVVPAKLSMGSGARIGHLNLIRGIELEMGPEARIGRYNWVYGAPTGSFPHARPRCPRLTMGRASGIVRRHLIDCSNAVVLGEFSLLAGSRSMLLTHSIAPDRASQDALPIEIGSYCFIGAACNLLGGSKLPDRSVLSAMSLLNQTFDEPQWLYGGVPAKALKQLPDDYGWFVGRREDGVVE